MDMKKVKLLTGETFELGDTLSDGILSEGEITSIWMGDNKLVMVEKEHKLTDIRIPFHAVSYYIRVLKLSED